jgi:hypothetical protein
LGGHLPHARKRHAAECLFGERAESGEVVPRLAGLHADQSQSQETLQYDIDLVNGGAGLLSDPSRVLAKSGEVHQTYDLEVRPVRDDGQSFGRPVAKLVLPGERGVIGSMRGGDVSLGFIAVKSDAPRPGIDLRDRNRARSAKDLRQSGMIGLKESGKGTQRVTRVLLLSSFELLPQTLGERGHRVIVIGGGWRNNGPGADCGANRCPARRGSRPRSVLAGTARARLGQV